MRRHWKLITLGALLLGAACLVGGTTNFFGLVVISDSSVPTGATATGQGDLLVEDALEVDGATDLDSTLTVAGAATFTTSATVGTTLGVTGASTFTGSISSPEISVAEVSISLAELTALRATNKTLVAAQGAGTIIVPERVVFFLDYGSAQVTETADNLALNYVDAAGDAICAFETTSSWLVAAADGYGSYECDTNILSTTAQAVNTAVTLDNNGDGEFGGGTGSTVTVWIYYRVLDVS